MTSLARARANKGWIGFDFDKTMAYYEAYGGDLTNARPFEKIIERIRKYLAEGKTVKIFTARVTVPTGLNLIDTFRALQKASEQEELIQKWLRNAGLPPLEVTNVKDWECHAIYDDKAVQVIPNTGELLQDHHADAVRRADALEKAIRRYLAGEIEWEGLEAALDAA